jgi:hypothetical protein
MSSRAFAGERRACSRRGCRPALADPAHLDDDHSLATDVAPVDEHQRTSLDGPQPRWTASESWAVEKDHRFAYNQFPGQPLDCLDSLGRQTIEQVGSD